MSGISEISELTPAREITIKDIAERLWLHALVLMLRRLVVEQLTNNIASITSLVNCGPIEIVILRVLLSGPKDTDSIRGLAALDMVTFSKAVRGLEKSGVVESFSGTHDKRRKLYALTKLGETAAKEANDAATRTEQTFLATLAPRDQSLFVRLLTKVAISHAVKGAVQQDARIATVLGGRIDPGTLLRRALQISAQFFEQTAGDLDVSPLEAAAVNSIAAFEPIAVKDLPRILSIDRGSAHAIVRKLKDADYLEHESHDLRTLELSETGRRFYERLAPRLAQIESHFLDGLSNDEQPRFMRVMRKLFVQLSEQ